MSLTEFVCPQCDAVTRSSKTVPAGAMVRCPQCKHVFRFEVAAPAAPTPAPPVPKPAAPKPASVQPVKSADSPSRVTSVSAQRKAQPAARGDERPSAARRRDEYDDESSPRSKKRKKSGSNSNVLIIGLAVGGLVLVLAVGGVIAAIALSGGKDEKNTASNSTPVPMPQNNLPDERVNRPQFGNPPNTRSNSTNQSSSTDSNVGQGAPSGGGSVQDVYTYVLKSTVLIVNEMRDGAAIGTGSVIDVNERLILTNHHVIADNQRLFVYFPTYEGGKLVAEKERYLGGGRGGSQPESFSAEVLAEDSLRDLALIRVPKLPPGIEALPMAKSDVGVGQTVHSVGNAGVSGALWVYTQGAVRSIYRKKWASKGENGLTERDSEVVETSSPTNQGDSGGPLVNDRGELVGVTEGFSQAGRQISLFISLNEARNFVNREYERKFAKAWSPIVRSPLRIRSGAANGGDLTSLISALDHSDSKQRASAARNLGEMGPDAKLAIPRLVKALKDSDELTSRLAAEALGKIGAPGRDDLPALNAALIDPKPEVRRYAAGAIGHIGPDASASAPQLVTALSDADDRVREGAAQSLGRLGSNVKSTAMPGLNKALSDRSKNVRVAAAASLTSLLSPPTADDVAVLVNILKQPDAETSVFGAQALAKLGKQAKAAIPELLEAAKTGDAAVRRGAIDSLAAIGPDAKAAIPIYLAALKDGGDSGVRQSALLALGQLGKELEKEKDAIAAIGDATKDSDAQVKKAALTAVGKLGPAFGAAGAKQVIPVINEALLSSDNAVRDHAFETIAGMGPLAKDAVGTLITMMEKQDIKLYIDETKKVFLQKEDEAFLDKIAKTIGKVGQPAVRILLASLNTTNVNFGLLIGICRSLGEIGPPAKSAIGTLQAISQQFPREIGFEADRALRKIATK